jgi:hypothetical protein
MSKYTPFNIVDDYKIKLQEAKITLGFSPTADVVEVVRCKDCKHYKTPECAMWLECSACGGQWDWCNPNDYCSYGERRCE